MIIAAADNLSGHSSAALASQYFPATPIMGRLDGNASLLSSARAEAMIGYSPRFGWRDARA